jgi:uncharacterized phiE125 gp8 family phage protein
MGLKRTIKPAVSPVTLDEAKQHVGLLSGDHDQHLARLIEAATEEAERYTGRALISQTWRLALDKFPCRWPRNDIRLPRPPLQSVTSIKYVDEHGILQTLDSALYTATADFEPARIEPAYGQVWPATRDEREAVRVTYVAGYGNAASNVPQGIRQAILLMAAQWFAHREPTSERTLAEVPMSARWLLDNYKTGAVAEWFSVG